MVKYVTSFKKVDTIVELLCVFCVGFVSSNKAVYNIVT